MEQGASEGQRAELYEHHGSDDEWGEPTPVEGSRRRLGAEVSVRLSQDALVAVRSAAAARRMSLSGFVRWATLEAVRRVDSQPAGAAQETQLKRS